MKNSYASKWILQRITALFLIPLTFWFIYHCISFQYSRFEEMKLFFQSYLNSFLFFIMIITMLIHGKLGCETIIQDYISSLYLQKIFKGLINFVTLMTFFLITVAIFKLNIIR
jgi:succinate dehydrogenase / fumarate reductase membrane anchor subunit